MEEDAVGRVIMGAAVSLDGFVAHEDDSVGPLFDWYGNGDVPFTFSDEERVFHVTEVTAGYLAELDSTIGAVVIGRRLFDLTDGWEGRPAAGDHVVVVTHEAPTDWAHAEGAPFTFVPGVREAVDQARARAGERDVSITAGDVGGQALRAGLVDRIAVNLVPAVLGAGRPFFGGSGTTGPHGPILLDDPVRVVQGERVLHLLYDVRR